MVNYAPRVSQPLALSFRRQQIRGYFSCGIVEESEVLQMRIFIFFDSDLSAKFMVCSCLIFNNKPKRWSEHRSCNFFVFCKQWPGRHGAGGNLGQRQRMPICNASSLSAQISIRFSFYDSSACLTCYTLLF